MADESKGMGFKGVLIGLVLIPLSFWLLYMGACRTQASDVYAKAKPMAEWKEGGGPFFVTGKVDPKKIGDKDFLGDDVPALTLGREVEVYSWYGEKKEKTKKKDKDKDKDKKKKKDKDKKKSKTTYKCKKDWVEKPKRDKEFEKGCASEGKPFFEKKIDSKKAKTAFVTIQDQSGSLFSVDEGMSFVDNLPLTADNISKYLKPDSTLVKKGDYFYDKASCGGDNIDTKTLGCHRVKFIGYIADPSADYTVFGGSLKTGVDPKGKGRIGAFETTAPQLCKGTKETCLKGLAKKDSRGTWAWWIASVLALFFGLSMVTGPLTNLMEKIPLIGGLGSGLLKFIFFVTSLIVMSVGFFLVKYFLFVLGGVVVLIIILVVMKKK